MTSKLRPLTITVCVLDAVAWGFIASVTFLSGSDPATKGLDVAAGAALTGLFAVTAAPACALVFWRRAPRTALLFALAFPAILALLLGVAIVAAADRSMAQGQLPLDVPSSKTSQSSGAVTSSDTTAPRQNRHAARWLKQAA